MVIHKNLDDCLSIRNGHLYMEECDTVSLLEQFGSPLFIMSENQIRRNVRHFKQSFEKRWPDGPLKVLPAAKANWIPAIQKILADEGCGCDIYSPGELFQPDPQWLSRYPRYFPHAGEAYRDCL